MAVDPSLFHETDALILPKPCKYYRAPIQTCHWQLRSLLSSPENHLLYYPSGQDVCVLNTLANVREIVTTLPFLPKCVTVANGWLCCGGDDGKYTVLSLAEGKTNPNLDTEPDARLPLDLDPSRRSIPRDTSRARIARSHGMPPPTIMRGVGTEIVNCITIWSPRDSISESSYKSPVAVVANNDATVHILDLENDSETLERLKFPDCVNRSLISMDGQLLVTICDDPFLYIHQRTKKQVRAEGHARKQEFEWSLREKIQLVGQHQKDKSNMRGSFAASFSKSGKYLAVATQYGWITVFETEFLMDESADPLVIFSTSRPNSESGAVRAMEFSPEPYDLLVWTESSGRVGVADVRNLFLSRQIVKIDSRADGIERVLVTERPSPDPVIDPRLRSFRSESPPSNTTTPDYLGFDFDPRQLSQLTREHSDRHRSLITAEELDILSAHQIARRQRDAAAAAGPSAWGTAVRQNGEANSSADRRMATAGSTAGYPAALREFINPDRTAASFRSFINERNQERDRMLQQQPRRRSSIILAAAEEQLVALGSARNSNDPSTSLERLTLTPPRLLDYPGNSWAESETVSRSRLLADPPLDRSARLRDDDRRDFAHRLRQPWNSSENLIPAGSALLGSMHRSGQVETMGCCWSSDGRKLNVAAEDGIYEFHVNVPGRKKFPSLVLR